MKNPMRILCLCALALLSAGCREEAASQPENAAQLAPDSEGNLTLQFQKIVKLAQAKDEAGILAALESYFLTRDEMIALFGEGTGERAWHGYNDEIASDLRKEAPKLLIDQVAEGLTEVTVERVGPAYPDRTTPGDQRMLDLMRQKQPMYTVRLHKPEEKLGLRLNGFIYIDGRWRGLFKTYDDLPGGKRLLEEAEKAAEEAEKRAEEAGEKPEEEKE